MTTTNLCIEETTFKGWKALRVKAGDLEVHVTPEIGGRINGCAYRGKEILYTQAEHEGKVVPRPKTLEALKKQKLAQGFRFYGGYKTWIGPQGDWPEDLPYFDLDSGLFEWSHTESDREIRIQMKSPICRESGIQLEKELIFNQGSSFMQINQGMRNHGKKSVRMGLWDVTQVLREAHVYLPIHQKSQLPEGIKIFDAENPDQQAVLKYTDRYPTFLVIHCTDNTRFKIGSDSEEGWLAGFILKEKGRWIVFKKTFEVFPSTKYAHGCSAEVFNSDERDHLEMEVHSPMAQLAAGARFTWMGHWTFHEVDQLPKSLADLENVFNRM